VSHAISGDHADGPYTGRMITGRLLVRPPEPADAEAIVAIHADPRTNVHNVDGPTPPAQARRWLDKWIADWNDSGIGYWAVESLTDPGPVLGFAGVKPGTLDGTAVLNLYYRFASSAWGHGYATEVARAAVALAMDRHPATPVVARIRRPNHASRRVAEHAGLHDQHRLDPEGRLIYSRKPCAFFVVAAGIEPIYG
jgi:RimJ/RimL family protein N-acetyltransferase